MKKSLFSALLVLLITNAVFAQAQSVPYQAVARDNSGNLIVNQLLNLRFTIHNLTAGGTTVYQETDTASTNSLGLFTVPVGAGTVTSGTFSGIGWGSGAKYMQVELYTGGSWNTMGTSQMMSVPYALYAGNAASVPSGNLTESDALNVLTIGSGTGAVLGSGTTIGVASNSVNQAGVVTAPTSSNNYRVWATDVNGNPGWRYVIGVAGAALTSPDITIGGANSGAVSVLQATSLTINKGSLTEGDTLHAITISGGSNSVLGTGTSIQIALNGADQAGLVPAPPTGDAYRVWASGANVNGQPVPAWRDPATALGTPLTSPDMTISANGSEAVLAATSLTINKGNLTEADTMHMLTIAGGTNAVLGTAGTSIAVAANAVGQAGVVAGPSATTNKNQVWGTSSAGVPGWMNANTAISASNITSTDSDITVTGGSGAALAATSVSLTKGALSEVTSNVLTISNGSEAVLGTGTTIKVKLATALQGGYLSAADWNVFNNKITGTGTQYYVPYYSVAGTPGTLAVDTKGLYDDAAGDLGIGVAGNTLYSLLVTGAGRTTAASASVKITAPNATGTYGLIVGGITGMNIYLEGDNTYTDALGATITNPGIYQVGSGSATAYSAYFATLNTSAPVLEADNTGSGNAATFVASASTGYGLLAYNTAAGGTAMAGINGAVSGTAVGVGVVGSTAQSGAGSAGVYGLNSNASGPGIIGINTAATGTGTGAGVIGSTAQSGANGVGVLGVNSNPAGGAIIGVNSAAAGTGAGAFGVFGETSQSGTGSAGIYGAHLNASGAAVVGVNLATAGTGGGIGAYGLTNQSGGAGIWGSNSHASGTGVVGYGNNVTPYGLLAGGSGGAFFGTNNGLYAACTSTTRGAGDTCAAIYTNNDGSIVRVNAFLNATQYKIYGNGTVSTTADGLNGEKVTLHCSESPEIYFEDYGDGKLINGEAHITIDPVFAKNVTVSDKHPMRVYIQLEGDCKGVYVTNKTGNSFDVKELAGGNSNTAFQWHIICNRADEVLPGGRVSLNADKRFETAPAAEAIAPVAKLPGIELPNRK